MINNLINLIITSNIEAMYKIHKLKNYEENYKSIINFAQKNVPIYMMLDKIVPIIEKDDIKRNNKYYFSNKNYNKRLLFLINKTQNGSAWSENTKHTDINVYEFIYICINIILKNYCFPNVTGGSSGNYFHQWYNLRDAWYGSYTFVKGWFNMGWKPNESILFFYKHGSISIKLLQYLPNIDLIVPELLNNDVTIECCYKLIKDINKKKYKLLVSFPNLLYRICELIYSKNIEVIHHPKYIDLSADFLYNCQYQFIKKIFYKSDIRLSYGTVEFGQIAQQLPNNLYKYEVYSDVAYVENKDNEIVVTSLINKVLPIIRYNTKDKGYIHTENNKQYITNLVGKQTHKYDYMKINNMIDQINGKNLCIINLKIIHKQKIIYIITINSNFKLDLIQKLFPNFIIKINKDCSYTIDKYNRKVTPIIDDYIEKFSL